MGQRNNPDDIGRGNKEKHVGVARKVKIGYIPTPGGNKCSNSVMQGKLGVPPVCNNGGGAKGQWQRNAAIFYQDIRKDQVEGAGYISPGNISHANDLSCPINASWSIIGVAPVTQSNSMSATINTGSNSNPDIAAQNTIGQRNAQAYDAVDEDNEKGEEMCVKDIKVVLGETREEMALFQRNVWTAISALFEVMNQNQVTELKTSYGDEVNNNPILGKLISLSESMIEAKRLTHEFTSNSNASESSKNIPVLAMQPVDTYAVAAAVPEVPAVVVVAPSN